MPIGELQIPYPDFEMGQIIEPDHTDLNNLYIQSKINDVILLINKLTDSVKDGDSGADKIALTPITPFVSTKVQAFLEEVIARLSSTTNGTSGADFIAATAIPGITGTTVMAQLKSLKALFDAEKTRVTNAMTAETTRVNGAMATETTRVNNLINTEILNVKNLINTEKARIDSLNTQVNRNTSNISTLTTQMGTHSHDNRYMTRDELRPFLQGGDTQICVDVFIIQTLDNGNQTFTYKNAKTGAITNGQLGNNGELIFTLVSSDYQLGLNHIKAIINDTLHRSVASGGLVEISPTEVALTSPEAIGTEITFEYYHRIGVSGEFSIHFGPNEPPPSSGSIMWYKVVG